VILATQEAEIRRILVQSQLGQNSPRVPISKKKKITEERIDRVTQGVGSEFKLQYRKEKKNRVSLCIPG
jgi:hypothetical protein